jgi:lipopolysaccharide export system protein LptA
MNNYSKSVLFFVLMLVSPYALAIEEDTGQPIYIESDRFSLEYQSGLAIYEGSVEATQGSRRLWGDRVTVKSTLEGVVQEIIVTGTPAHYHYQPKDEGKPAIAEALTIQYEPQKHLFTLMEEAQIEREGNLFKGPLITYNTETEVIDSPSTKQGRASMVLQPVVAEHTTGQ